jgi:hypothetical protein
MLLVPSSYKSSCSYNFKSFAAVGGVTGLNLSTSTTYE